MADMMTDIRNSPEAFSLDGLLHTLRVHGTLPEWPLADVQFTLNLKRSRSFAPSEIELGTETDGFRQLLGIDRWRDVIECLRLLADYWEKLEIETDILREDIRHATRNLADRDVGRVAKWLHEEGLWATPFPPSVRPEPSRTATKE